MYIYIYLNIHIYSLMSGSFPCFSAPPISKYQGIPNQIHPNSPNSKQLKPKPTQSQTENQYERSKLNPNPNPTQQPCLFFKIWNQVRFFCSTIPSSFAGRPSVEVVFPQQGSIFIPAHLRVLHVTQEAIILEKSPWRNLHLGFGLSPGDVTPGGA